MQSSPTTASCQEMPLDKATTERTTLAPEATTGLDKARRWIHAGFWMNQAPSWIPGSGLNGG